MIYGHHAQFNVVTAETLRKAPNPEKYKGLIVGVAGYSNYFVNLSEELQKCNYPTNKIQWVLIYGKQSSHAIHWQ